MTTDEPTTKGATKTSLTVVELLKERDGAGVTELPRYLDIPTVPSVTT